MSLRLAFVLALAAAPAAALQSRTGTNAAEFLRLGAGARALGMGEAYAAVAEGSEAMHWNPAGLAQLRRPELSYTRSQLFGSVHHDYAAYAQPVSWLGGSLGASFTRLSQERLPLVTAANERLGHFRPESVAGAIGYATSFDLDDFGGRGRNYFSDGWLVPRASRPLRDGNELWTGSLMAGLALKLAHERYHHRNATALALDGGVIFRPIGLQRLSLAFSFRNVGQKARYIEEGQPLPAELSFAAAFDHRTWGSRWLPAAEVSLPYAGDPAVKVGLEHSRPLGEELRGSVRLGYKTASVLELGPLAGVTFGLGARWRRFHSDFGFQPLAQLGEVYRLTIGLTW